MLDGIFDFISENLLQFFGWVSSLIYGMVSIVTQGFFNLSYIEIFTSETIQDITARIYVVLAVFMIFKLAFSLIQYLVNPDQVNDKQAGMGKLVSRTATAFILLIAVPIIFDEFVFGPPDADSSNTYQAIIARSIPRIILGSSGGESEASSLGETMAATAFSAFVQPREECEGAPLLTNATISDIADATYARCSEVVEGGESSVFAYDYNWLFGLAVGLVMLVIMLFFTVDVAIRAIKLGILRIIAPIPIISYVDPKSAKDGSFNNWLKALISTFAELFIKIAVIYIIMYVIIQLTSAQGGAIDFGNLSTGEALYARVFIIIGLLLFAVQASAFIKNIFGIKDQGLGTGLGMLMGGAGALLAGGGIAGMARGMIQGGTEGAQGKASFGNFNKGKELAAKTAKGQAHAQRKAERQAAKLGYDDARMSDLKQEASAAEEELAIAQAEMQADPTNVEKQQAYRAALARSKRANKAVEDAKEIRKNPALAKARGDAYSRSGYAMALAREKSGQVARNVGNAVGTGAQKVGSALYNNVTPVRKATDLATGAAAAIQAGIVESQPVQDAIHRRELYDIDRTHGGQYLDEFSKENRQKEVNGVPKGEPGSIEDYASQHPNVFNNNNNNGQGGPGTGGMGGTP